MWTLDAEPSHQDSIHKGLKYAMNCHYNIMNLNWPPLPLKY